MCHTIRMILLSSYVSTCFTFALQHTLIPKIQETWKYGNVCISNLMYKQILIEHFNVLKIEKREKHVFYIEIDNNNFIKWNVRTYHARCRKNIVAGIETDRGKRRTYYCTILYIKQRPKYYSQKLSSYFLIV